MKPLNLSGKILLIPMDQLPQDTRDTLRREDGMQTIAGTNVFVYATGRVVSGCCCGGGHHHHEEYNPDEADETFFEPEDLAYGKDEPITETIDDNLLLVVNEPVIIVNTSDAARIGFDVSQARPFDLPPEGVTLVPGRDVDKGYFQTGPISIQLRD